MAEPGHEAKKSKSKRDISRLPEPPVLEVATSSLKPHPANAREHPERQLVALEKSVRKFGIRQALLVWRGLVIAGCGRLRVAERLGLETVPTRDLSEFSEAEAREYMLHDNALAELARWNEELKALEVADLTKMGADFAGILQQAELDRFLRPSFQDPDAAIPALQDSIVSRAGDVWLLDGHRIICGDATSAETVGALLGDDRPHLMVTDPPYGVEYDPSWREGAGLSDGAKVARGKVLNDDRADWSEAWRLFPGSVAYVWHGALHNVTVAKSLVDCGFKIRAQIIWVKSRPAISRGHYHWAHEPAFYAVQEGADEKWQPITLTAGFEEDHEEAAYACKDGNAAQWRGGRRMSTVWQIAHMRNDSGHGTQKPIECMRRPILNNSVKGDGVYEPFSGSGTTICAAEQTGRRCFAVELNPQYVDLAVRRWQEMTGAIARRASDGAAFNDVEPRDGKARTGGKDRSAEGARGKSRAAKNQTGAKTGRSRAEGRRPAGASKRGGKG